MKLSPLQLKGTERRSALQGTTLSRKDGYGKAFIHSTARCEVIRVDQDALIVTDGAGGYTPFSISGLTALLKEVKKSPIAQEVKL